MIPHVKQNDFYRKVDLPAGQLHVYASEDLFNGLSYKVFEMANNNLQIPNINYMGYTPDVHIGIGTCIGTTAIWHAGNGYISPSIVGSDIGCGMRVHLTNLHKKDLKDVQLRKKVIKRVEKYLSLTNNQRGHFTDIRLENILRKGLHGLPNKYIPDSYTPKKATSLTHVEKAKFSFDDSFLDLMPEKAFHRGHSQLGTLGGGNHFAEFQHIQINEQNRQIAEKWGMFDGQIVVMIHSGSRAWGGSVVQQSRKDIIELMNRYELGTSDPGLIFAPLDTDAAQIYKNLMYSALNYAVVNRHLIAFAIREACRDVFGTGFEMSTLYDLMHNYALEEEYNGEAKLVHRKGATKALPANNPHNPKPYIETGHPALIPGSMGTSSYIMVGQQAGADNYHSICHGAGRIRSRSETKRVVTVAEFEQSLRVGKPDEIVVNQTLQSILDESPQAYKDVDEIINSVMGANLADVVARCKPIASIKSTK